MMTLFKLIIFYILKKTLKNLMFNIIQIFPSEKSVMNVLTKKVCELKFKQLTCVTC